MAMRCELLETDSGRWGSVLGSAVHDFYHLPGYARLSARIQGGEARGLLVSGAGHELLLPLVIRPVPGGSSDATSPYGYAGPVVAGHAEEGVVPDALRVAAGFLAGEGIVSLFVRFHPLLNATPPRMDGVVRDGDTVTIDLRLPAEEAWRQTRRDHRAQILRARSAGHRVILDAGPEHELAFRRLYHATMTRLGADPFYFFDDRYFDELREVLGDRFHLVVVEIEGETAAAGIFVETSGIVEYHLSGSDERFRVEGPTKLMIDAVRRWAAERGHRWLHLGGGFGFAHDSVFDFKTGFSKTRTPAHSLRMILRPDEYERLARASGASPPHAVSADYFPAYRRPPERRTVEGAGRPAGAALTR